MKGDAMKERDGMIYALSDPRDGSIRYIGKTTQSLLERLAQHLASPTNPAMRVWINALSLQGTTPCIDALATVPESRLAAEEVRQIEDHHQKGHRLLNAPHYRTNIADLVPHSKAQHRAADAVESMFATLYLPVVRAYATRERSLYATIGIAAVLIVLTGAPAALLLALASNKMFRGAIYLAWAGWITWSIGFDKAIQDLLLVHVPTAPCLDFWHEYLVKPVTSLAVGTGMVSLVVSFLAYRRLAEGATQARRNYVSDKVRRPLP